MNKKILFLLFIIFSLSAIGLGCTKQIITDQASQTVPIIATDLEKNDVCVEEGQSPTDNVKCCVGLEAVAVDNAFAVCGKPGTSYKPKECMDEGETPFVDTPKCCGNLEPVLKGDKYVCAKKLIDSKSTDIHYYLLENPVGSNYFCDGQNEDSKRYKKSLTKKITLTVPGNLTIEEKIKTTLGLAAKAQFFNESYTRTDSIIFENGVVTMHSASGWAGSSIFYCAWTPFVERNLEQFREVKEIKWQASQ